MKIGVKPIYGKDYAPGYTLFTRPVKGGFISDGIIWFQNLDEVVKVEELLSRNIFPKGEGFSHVVGIIDEEEGIEATEKGIHKVKLSHYFSGKYFVICRKPEGIDAFTAQQKIDHQLSLEGNGYDFTSYPQFVVNTVLKLQDWVPGLKKYPPLGHLKGKRVCSTLEADSFNSTAKYHEKAPFDEWNVHRFHVHKLWKLFPYKPFHFTEREGVHIEIKELCWGE